MSQSEPANCVRCRQPLPEGSGFCVSCGFNNEAALMARRVKVVEQADERIGWTKRLKDFTRGLGGLFRRF
jgi:hypothetical protein